MAPHSLSVGDLVTHPDWPIGVSRTVVGFSLFQRLARNARGRTRLVDSPDVRIVYLDEAVTVDGGETDDAWMEAGLLLVEAGE